MNLLNFSKRTTAKASAALMHMALFTGSLSAGGASAAYYAGRRGNYSNNRKNQSYLADHSLSHVSKSLYEHKRRYQLKHTTPEMAAAEELCIHKAAAVQELLIVDRNIKDFGRISSLAKPGIEVIEIPEEAEGVAYIEALLKQYQGLHAVHLFSHAHTGELQLGATKVNSQTLYANSTFLKTLKTAVRPGGDLLFYGCELAKGDKGAEFLEIIQTNTGLDVAASDDLTGNPALHGDWDLEITKGNIEATPLAGSPALVDFTEVLQIVFTPLNAQRVGSGGYYANDNISFNEDSGNDNYTLIFDGKDYGTHNYSGGGDYAYTYASVHGETAVYLYFSGNTVFDPSSLEIGITGIFGSPVTFTVSSDVSGSVSSNPLGHGQSQQLNLSNLADNTTKLTITGNDEFQISIGDIRFTSIGGASNNTPTAISLSNSSINQSATGINIPVGSLSTTDADVGDTHTYSLVSGAGSADNASFNISGNSLRTGAVLAAGTYNIRVNTNDGTVDYAEALTITVVDDSPPTISINDVSQNEGNSDYTNFTFTISLSKPSNETIGVDYASASGSALGGLDYLSASGSLTFASGETTKTVSILVHGETLDENDETFAVNLSNATNASISDASGTGTILNDDTAFQPNASLEVLSIYNPISDESGGQAFVRVKLDGVSGKTVTIPLTFSGTASGGGTDYSITSSSINISPGQTMDSMRITSVYDGFAEGDETIIIDMGTPTHAVEDGVQQVTITIRDEDCTAPSAASNLVFGTATVGTINLNSFTSGSGDGFVVYINSVNSFVPPTDGTEPVADLSWNDAGQQPIYFGTSNAPSLSVTGLEEGTTYYFAVYAYRACGTLEKYETTGAVASSSTLDVTSPSFENSTPSAANVGGTSFTLNTDIDEAGDLFYVVLLDGATAPTSTEVISGTGHAGASAVTSDNASVSTGGFTKAFSVTGLSSETAYDVYVVARDDASTPNIQGAPTLVNVTTADITAPSFENSTPNASGLQPTGFTLNTDIDEAGDLFYVVLLDGATAPTSTEVVNSTGHAGATAVASGNASVNTGSFTHQFSVTGLNEATDYDVYVVARDDAGSPNLQASPTLVNLSTPPANQAPTASSVAFSGSLQVGQTLNGTYTYNDTESDPESGTTFKWYRADDASGTNKTAITGATSTSYTLVLADTGKYISFEVIPNDGISSGTAVESNRQGPVLKLSASASSVSHVTCNGGSDGEVILDIQNGSAPYSLNWGSGSGSGSSISSLSAGNYTISISDQTGQSTTIQVTINEPAALNGGAVQ